MNACQHHWLCGPPIDGLVAALCKHCGERRVFGPPAVRIVPAEEHTALNRWMTWQKDDLSEAINIARSARWR